jgi:hypothetical protein
MRLFQDLLPVPAMLLRVTASSPSIRFDPQDNVAGWYYENALVSVG